MIRMLTRAALLLPSLAGAPVLAQTPSAGEATRAAASERPALRVVVDAAEAGLDSYAVQRAIESELGVIVHGEEHPNVVGTLRVVATGPDALTMEYTGNDGRRNSRTVGLPADSAKRIETVALVAGNLARDETGQLIEELRPPEPPVDSSASVPAAPAAAEPTPTAVAARAPARAAKTQPSPAKPAPKSASEPPVPKLEHEPVNLAVFSPIALYSNAPELEFSGQLGLFYSDVGRLRGGSLTLLAARVRYGFQGAQVSGLASFTDGASEGASVAGFAQVLRGDLAGASVSGFGSYSEGSLSGAEVAGALSLRRGNAAGVQLAGLLNFAHDVSGVQLAGAANLARNASGVQLSGVGNMARSSSGLMLTGGLNLATETVTGAQVSLMNLAQSLEGVQIGLVNVARSVNGVQLGLINVAEEVDGASVGLLPIAGNGYQRFVTWTTPGVASASAGAKLGVGPLYTLLGIGYDHVDGEDRLVSTGGLGVQWERGRLQLSLDALSQSWQVVNEGDADAGAVDEGASGDGEDEFFVSVRPLVGFRLQPWLRVIGGPAVVSGPHDSAWNRDVKLRGVAGIEVF